MHSTNPAARAFQHRMCQGINLHLAAGKALDLSEYPFKFEATNEEHTQSTIVQWLQNMLTKTCNINPRKFLNASLEHCGATLKFPR
ncbi:hypothetical protein LU631_20395 [Erwinia tracheiphila]|uniref:Uncharacterized protein n=1 Tax=Erwinia tracheiphila TaxID=65700 RepID=A0A345CTP1_9GAMM|nr:hypothetical protein [Erwinia tracheiphila]AXF76808.1 hypothetical protein AV903_13390 [Erwinia tracheiphila]UIA87112.1 hypothetical protein LU631_20395 [Erwinia tracheiphila]